MENIKQGVPESLLGYEKWWGETYGKDLTPEQSQELVDFADSLKNDEVFAPILTECLLHNINSKNLSEYNMRMALTEALSTYGMKFGLQVD